LERQPKNESARSIYNFAVARVVQHVVEQILSLG
jgi:hypothetical protein